jgi:hypothetical protein
MTYSHNKINKNIMKYNASRNHIGHINFKTTYMMNNISNISKNNNNTMIIMIKSCLPLNESHLAFKLSKKNIYIYIERKKCETAKNVKLRKNQTQQLTLALTCNFILGECLFIMQQSTKLHFTFNNALYCLSHKCLSF